MASINISVRRHLTPLVDNAWARSCSRCGFGNNIKLESELDENCECRRDGIRILDWSRVQMTPISRTAYSLPLPKPPPISPRGNPKKIHVDRERLLASVYNKTHEHRRSKKNANGRVVLRYTDASIIQPAATVSRTGHFSNTSFPKLSTKYVSKSNGSHVKPSQTPITNCVDHFAKPKLSIINTHFY